MERMIRDAVISEDDLYRYVLLRKWDTGDGTIVWIMLNPSTADHAQDDPTVRRCIRFSQEWGYRALVVVNLFAIRVTDPKRLPRYHDPVGPKNDEWIMEQTNPGLDRTHVAAWGSNTFARERAQQVMLLVPRLQCLGQNKDGSPKHPLYIRQDSELRSFT